MRLYPSNCELIGDGLDHPESVCLDAEGVLYAGGEAGQVYRIDKDGRQQTLATTGGFLLGIALDGDGCIHACDVGNQALMAIQPNGAVTTRATEVKGRRFTNPNHGVFDASGNFYMSDSGDYWQQDTGNGVIVRVDPQNSTELFHGGPFRFANGVAVDPTGRWLYIAQSTSANVVRIPFDEPQGPVEVTHTLPEQTVPDGLLFAEDGRLIIACYKPDALFIGQPDGTVELLCEDPTGELLSRPTNAAIGDGKLYISNLGGWHITAIATDMKPALIHRPSLRR